MSTLAVVLIVISSLLTLWSVASAFVSWRWAAATAYAALWPLCYIPGMEIPESLLIFWGIAALIALGITYMLPFEVATARLGMGFMTGGALCGMMVGLIASSNAGTICGSAAGVLLGAIAFSRTRRGVQMEFPSKKFFNYLMAKGLPLVVIMSSAGLVIMACYQFFTMN